MEGVGALAKSNKKRGADPQKGPLGTELTVTIFSNRFATDAPLETEVTLRKLTKLPKHSNAKWKAKDKSQLRHIKLGSFTGDLRPLRPGEPEDAARGYRSNETMIEATGIEVDYDAGSVPLKSAADAFEKAGVAALLLTTPSHYPLNKHHR